MWGRGEIMGHRVKEIRGGQVCGEMTERQVKRDIVAEIALPVQDHLM